MLISVRHITRYRYAEPVRYTIQSLRLTPLSFVGQRVLDWQVRAGGASPGLQFRDGFGNIVHLLTVNGRHEELVIEAVARSRRRTAMAWSPA
jgi:transglutaminase-like putative cysteine protease